MHLNWFRTSYKRLKKRAYLLIVDLPVLLQIGARSELLIADLADVGLFPGMNSLMPDEVRDLSKVSAR